MMRSCAELMPEKNSILLGMVLVVAAMAGCVTTPEKPATEDTRSVIELTENKSIDLSVRQDFKLATKLLHEQRYEEAIILLNKVIQASQQNSSPYINISIAYRESGNIELAEENLKKALEINPKHPVTLNEYALLYRKTGRYTEARNTYQKLVQLYPEFMPARRNFGILCELYLNDVPCATSQYQAYLKANPNDKDVQLWLSGLQQ